MFYTYQAANILEKLKLGEMHRIGIVQMETKMLSLWSLGLCKWTQRCIYKLFGHPLKIDKVRLCKRDESFHTCYVQAMFSKIFELKAKDVSAIKWVKQLETLKQWLFLTFVAYVPRMNRFAASKMFDICFKSNSSFDVSSYSYVDMTFLVDELRKKNMQQKSK